MQWVAPWCVSVRGTYWTHNIGVYSGCRSATQMALGQAEVRHLPSCQSKVLTASCNKFQLDQKQGSDSTEKLPQPGDGGRKHFPLRAQFNWWVLRCLFQEKKTSTRITSLFEGFCCCDYFSVPTAGSIQVLFLFFSQSGNMFSLLTPRWQVSL